MSIFDGADNVKYEDRKAAKYLNSEPGTYTLTITRAEVSKNGTHIVVEFGGDAGECTALFDLSRRSGGESWKRDREIKSVKSLTAAALERKANDVTQAELD